MKRILTIWITLLLAAGVVHAQAGGASGNPAASAGVPITTVAGLASVPNLQKGSLAVVTNGSSGTDCTVGGGSSVVTCQYSGAAWAQLAAASSGATAWSAITGGTNANALIMGAGGSLARSGGGTIDASTLLGNTWAAPGAIGGTTPGAGTFTAGSFTTITASTSIDLTHAINPLTWNQNTTGTAAAWTTARNLAGNSVNGTANVAFANAFIVQGTADAGLSGAQFMGALGTGIVKNTTTTGVQSIAVAGDFPTLNQNTTGTAANLLSCTPAAAGDICVYNGAAWAKLAGNSVGTKFLQETSSGVASWAASAGSSAWDALTAPSGNLSLSMGSNTSTFNTTTALSQFFAWKNTTAAVIGTSQGSPVNALCGRAFHASADVEDCMTFSELPGNGNDAAIAFNIGHIGTSTGVVTTNLPGPLAIPASGGVGGMVSMTEGTAPASLGTASQDNCYGDSTAHQVLCKDNNGTTRTDARSPTATTTGNVTSYVDTQGNLADAGFLATNVVRKDAANTGAAAMTLDMSASTSAAALRWPNIAGASSATAGVSSYDTTNKNFHGGANGVDNIFGIIPSSISPANNDCVKWTVAASVVTLNTAGGACGAGSSALSAITAAAGANSINNGDNAQTWNWAISTAAKTAFTFTENTAAVNGAGSQWLAKVGTIAGSTAVPLNVFGSLTGSQTLHTLEITPTWNTSGVVDGALFINPTNTGSGAASLLIKAQLAGATQWTLDKAGNTIQVGSAAFGTSPPGCTAGTAGGICFTEGTNLTNVSGTTAIDANSTTHEISVATNGSSSFGTLVRVQPGTIHQTAQTASIGTATLCAASAGACNTAGQYHVSWDFIETGTACSVVTAGGVTLTISYTDSNGTSHAHVMPMIGEGAVATTPALNASFFFQTSLANAFAHGDANISTNGTVIQYATTYTACTTGTGTYQLDVVVERLQ